MLLLGGRPSSKLFVWKGKKSTPPGVDWLFSITVFKSDIKPELDVSQYISKRLSTGFVSYTASLCTPGIFSVLTAGKLAPTVSVIVISSPSIGIK